MKNLASLKSIIYLFVLLTFLSCKEDDHEINLSDELIGAWQRSDFNDEFEYTLTFFANNTGVREQREGDLDGQVTSSAVSYTWDATGDILDLIFDGVTITTNFSLNSDGNLLLNDFTKLYFIRLN